MKHAKNGLKLNNDAKYSSHVFRPGQSREGFGFKEEWPEKYGRDLSGEALGMKKLEGFKEVDQEKRRRKIAERERKKRRNKIVYIAIQSVLAAVMLFAAAKIGENYKSNVAGREHHQAVRELTGNSAEPVVYITPAREVPGYPIATPKRIEYPAESFPKTREDLQVYKNLNDDFKFWFYMPDSQLSYYVLQGKSNDEYLRMDIFREYNHSGCLFLDYRCNAKTMEGHTIIYGHTMNDISIFGELRDFLEKDYYDTHRYFYTLALDSVTMWRVFSVYITTVDEYYIETFFRTPADYLDFINGLKNSSMYQSDVELVETDDVLTLSTCYRLYHGADGRLVVHAVKVGSSPML
ncbi:MAG: class B sortase [Clostridia bacterium]|nr:class B sortase [Clostridia bacterium]